MIAPPVAGVHLLVAVNSDASLHISKTITTFQQSFHSLVRQGALG
jgi:hypothetical protein